MNKVPYFSPFSIILESILDISVQSAEIVFICIICKDGCRL
ncbi:unnamed protein product [Moneuplotes crassus]|uniref:Uncharacterized protein n=1 Tax=Euplotes crassus TaxID=5936 RepID=A0AAD1XW33_EUPCR|nr:unnamed protein product [Moneuplotes crassus]